MRIEGQASVERTQGDAWRSWTAPFSGTPAEADEEQTTFDFEHAPAPPPHLIV